MRRDERAMALALWLVLAPAAGALSPDIQQRVAALPDAERQALEARRAELEAMTPVQRQVFAQRVWAWDALPIAVRRERRERWQAWQALPLEQQLQVRIAATAHAAMPLAKQRALRQRFDALDDSDRHGWLLGPALGADYAVLQPLLAQVPDTQRSPLLALLRALTPGERLDLGVLAQRTPPPQRDALRRALLSMPAYNRGAWLRQRLDQ